MYRSDYRAGAIAALQASVHFAGLGIVKAWVESLDETSLPAACVVTPREVIRRIAKGDVERVTTVQVVLKRLGRDTIEDDLDEDAAEIERVVWPALDAISGDVQMTAIDIASSIDGQRRIGTVTATFSVTRYSDEADPD